MEDIGWLFDASHVQDGPKSQQINQFRERLLPTLMNGLVMAA